MKNYLNSIYLKQVEKLQDVIQLSGKTDLIIEELKKYTNEKGYIKLFINKRQQPSKSKSHNIYYFKSDKQTETT